MKKNIIRFPEHWNVLSTFHKIPNTNVWVAELWLMYSHDFCEVGETIEALSLLELAKKVRKVVKHYA